ARCGWGTLPLRGRRTIWDLPKPCRSSIRSVARPCPAPSLCVMDPHRQHRASRRVSEESGPPRLEACTEARWSCRTEDRSRDARVLASVGREMVDFGGWRVYRSAMAWGRWARFAKFQTNALVG